MLTEYPLLNLQSIPSCVLSVDRASFFAKITPDTAKVILDKLNYTNQRHQNYAKKLQLIAAMKDGTFEPISTLMFCVENDKSVHLVNGQHTLAAMVEANSTYALPVQIYKGDPDKLYPKIDRGKPRSLKDAIRSNRTNVSMGMSETAVANVARGVKVILNGYTILFRGILPASEDIILKTTIDEYKVPATRYLEILDSLEYGRKLCGQIPMSLFLTLYKKVPDTKLEKVDDFAYGSASGIGLTEGDPRRLIYGMYAERARYGYSGRKYPMSKADEMATLLGCWDNWYNGRLRKHRYRVKDLGKVLTQSPNVAGTDVTFKYSIPKSEFA